VSVVSVVPPFDRDCLSSKGGVVLLVLKVDKLVQIEETAS